MNSIPLIFANGRLAIASHSVAGEVCTAEGNKHGAVVSPDVQHPGCKESAGEFLSQRDRLRLQLIVRMYRRGTVNFVNTFTHAKPARYQQYRQ